MQWPFDSGSKKLAPPRSLRKNTSTCRFERGSKKLAPPRSLRKIPQHAASRQNYKLECRTVLFKNKKMLVQLQKQIPKVLHCQSNSWSWLDLIEGSRRRIHDQS